MVTQIVDFSYPRFVIPKNNNTNLIDLALTLVWAQLKMCVMKNSTQ